ncbi:MAG: hypothetical protein ABIN57_00090 [Chitinophagaceae bacterium]
MKAILNKLKVFEKASFYRQILFAFLFVVFVVFILQVLINSPA